ncbi:MAG: thioredoxin-disulfide reductase [Chloroflexota bacterium]|nr:thioredoxin-disulfide reductase [Chloroflexota bacterium]
MNETRQVIIIGGGPAGLAAGLYTSRARLSNLLIEKGIMGGLMVLAEVIENYPGFPEGISGYDLAELMHKQATKYGLATLVAEVAGFEVQGKLKVVRTSQGDFAARVVIIAGGSERQKLGVPGEKDFIGKGVSYCATCDATFFEGVPVAIVGGGDSAISEALHLTKYASKVTLIHRRDQLRATRIMQEKAFAEPKMEFRWSSVVESIEGDTTVNRLRLRQVATGEKSTLEVAGIFVSVGFKPNTAYLKGIVPLDAGGLIITNDKMETEIPGVYAAGDIRHNSGRQVITAAGEGAAAAINAEHFVTESG